MISPIRFGKIFNLPQKPSAEEVRRYGKKAILVHDTPGQWTVLTGAHRRMYNRGAGMLQQQRTASRAFTSRIFECGDPDMYNF